MCFYLGRILIAIMLIASSFAGANTPVKVTAFPFTVEFPRGNESVAQRTFDILTAGAREFALHLPVGEEPVRVVLCDSYNGFRALAGSYGRARVGGIAQGEAGLIILKTPNLLPPEQNYDSVVRHELIHVLLARNVDPANVPRWLNEGVSMVISREHRWGNLFHLAEMYFRGRLISYVDLDVSFAPLGDEMLADNAYTQAYSMTQYLQSCLGEGTFWRMVSALKTTDFEAALKEYAGLTPGAFYDAWRRSLWKVALITSLVSGFSLFQIMALLVIVAYWLKFRRGQRLMNQWDWDERLGFVGGDKDEAVCEAEEDSHSWEENEEEEDRRR